MANPSPPEPFAVFTQMRDKVFREFASLVGPAPAATPADAGVAQVVGVVMDFTVPSANCLVFGLRDGTASVYLSTGGGFIGGQGRPQINAAAKKLVEVAAPFVDRLPPVDQHPLPAAGRVRLSLLTTAGVRAADADEAELRSSRGELLPLFDGAHAILTGYRTMHQDPPNERTYVNCLLVALGRGNTPSVTLTEGTPPPDPAQLTADPTDLQWFAEVGFDCARLSTAKVISELLKAAGFGLLAVLKNEGTIRSKMVAHGGKSATDVVFRVRRNRRDRPAEIEVSLVSRQG
jgi:hypothetical protein